MKSLIPLEGVYAPCEHPSGVGGGVFYATQPTGSPAAFDEMKRETLHLGSLDTIIDRLTELFDHWEQQQTFPPDIRLDVLYRARLAAHEWIAVLVQHADFEDRLPQIALSVWPEGARLHCLIADNSAGFNPAAFQPDDLNVYEGFLPERGMWWLLIQACTDEVSYRPLGNQGFGLEFFIS